jgi:hypothetical protein
MLLKEDIQPGKYLQIDRSIRLNPNQTRYYKWQDDCWEISQLCNCRGQFYGTIVDIDDVGITLNGTNGTFKVDHKFIALYWVPYRMVDAAGKSLNVGDKVYYSDSKGELIKGEIESILGWGYSRTSTAGIQFKLINIEYPEHYKRQEYKTRTVVAGSTVIKVN